jgi:hypothetical protein
MRRRAISEAVSAVLLLAVIATASYFALSSSTKTTLEDERTITETIRLKGSQVQELLSVISTNSLPDNVTVEILNYGTREIVIERVFADGVSLPFTVSDSDGNVFANNTVPPRKIIMLQLSGVGNSIQILTGSKNLIRLVG